MIHGVIELGDKAVHEVMVPRIGIRAVNVDDPIDEVLDTIVAAGHSRLPVFDESLDNIVGILYAKDLLPYLKGNGPASSEIDLRSLVRPPVYVPESKPVDDLLHEMQVAKRHIAIVVDEYGGTAGLVTMEDVVEEIVGEIQDEYDTEEPMVEEVSTDGELAYRLDGRVSMDDLRDLFDLSDDDEPDEDAYDTVGGFVVHRVGRIPLPGAEIPFRDDVVLRVEAAEPRRVARVVAARRRDGERGRRRRGRAGRERVTPARRRSPRARGSPAPACHRAGRGASRGARAPGPGSAAPPRAACSRAPQRSRISSTSATSASDDGAVAACAGPRPSVARIAAVVDLDEPIALGPRMRAPAPTPPAASSCACARRPPRPCPTPSSVQNVPFTSSAIWNAMPRA